MWTEIKYWSRLSDDLIINAFKQVGLLEKNIEYAVEREASLYKIFALNRAVYQQLRFDDFSLHTQLNSMPCSIFESSTLLGIAGAKIFGHDYATNFEKNWREAGRLGNSNSATTMYKKIYTACSDHNKKYEDGSILNN